MFWISTLLFTALVACNSKKEKEVGDEPDVIINQTVTPNSPAKNDDGTTFGIGDDGIQFENKDGGKETNINIGSDTGSIEIKRPD